MRRREVWGKKPKGPIRLLCLDRVIERKGHHNQYHWVSELIQRMEVVQNPPTRLAAVPNPGSKFKQDGRSQSAARVTPIQQAPLMTLVAAEGDASRHPVFEQVHFSPEAGDKLSPDYW